jgi:hypothetical protein
MEYGSCNANLKNMNKLKQWNQVVYCDFPADKPVDRAAIDMTKNQSYRFRGSMRISTGRIWVNSEFEKYRRRILNTPLP